MTLRRKSLSILKLLVRLFFILVSFLVVLLFIFITFFSIQRGFRETKNRSEVAPKNGRFIQISDGKIFIQETGVMNDTPVLFIHGTGAWSELWRGTLDRCAEFNLYCIAVDLPPFGFSEITSGSSYSRLSQAKRITELLKTLNPKAKYTLVGHSFGAGPTVESLMEDGSQVSRLVIVDGALSIDPIHKDVGIVDRVFAHRFVRNTILSSVVTNPLFTKQLLLPLLYNKQAATDERVQLLRRPLVVTGATDHLGDWSLDFMNSVNEQNLSSQSLMYKSITIPTLVIWGEKDSITPLEQGEKIHALISGSRFVVLKNVGHMPQIEDVDGFNTAVFSFINNEK